MVHAGSGNNDIVRIFLERNMIKTKRDEESNCIQKNVPALRLLVFGNEKHAEHDRRS